LNSKIIYNNMFKNSDVIYYRSIISSKIILLKTFSFPAVKKVVVFFIINIKYYNKNMLLLYMIIYLCFYCNVILYNKEFNNYQIVKFSLQSNKIIHFLNSFITVYLPNLEVDQNVIKKTTVNFFKKKQVFLYRIHYINFPVIPEMNFIYYSNEHIYNVINEYQVRFDIYLKNICFSKNSLEFLLHLNRFPLNSKVLFKK
tara:strand:+ start:1046 stop:1642 length:597 start_codon:yes stop_codon:yes gene_type:complete